MHVRAWVDHRATAIPKDGPFDICYIYFVHPVHDVLLSRNLRQTRTDLRGDMRVCYQASCAELARAATAALHPRHHDLEATQGAFSRGVLRGLATGSVRTVASAAGQ